MIQKITITFSILTVLSFLICRYAPSDKRGIGDAIQGGFLALSVVGLAASAITYVWLL